MQKLIAPLLLFLVFHAAGQSLDTTDVRLSRSADSSGQDLTLPVYNGRVFYGHLATTGHAFYATKDWQDGAVLYEGNWYSGLSLKFDLYKDEVIVLHPSLNPIRLYSDRVQQFVVGGQEFVRLTRADDSTLVPGFYQRLVQGEMTILALRKKYVEESIGESNVVRAFTTSDHYFVFKDGHYYPVRKVKSLLNLVKSERQSIIKQLKQRGIRYKRETERGIVAAAEIYNQSK